MSHGLVYYCCNCFSMIAKKGNEEAFGCKSMDAKMDKWNIQICEQCADELRKEVRGVNYVRNGKA